MLPAVGRCLHRCRWCCFPCVRVCHCVFLCVCACFVFCVCVLLACLCVRVCFSAVTLGVFIAAFQWRRTSLLAQRRGRSTPERLGAAQEQAPAQECLRVLRAPSGRFCLVSYVLKPCFCGWWWKSASFVVWQRIGSDRFFFRATGVFRQCFGMASVVLLWCFRIWRFGGDRY